MVAADKLFPRRMRSGGGGTVCLLLARGGDALHPDEYNKKTTGEPVACGTSNGNRTHDFALRGQRLNRLTMEADGWGTRIRT